LFITIGIEKHCIQPLIFCNTSILSFQIPFIHKHCYVNKLLYMCKLLSQKVKIYCDNESWKPTYDEPVFY